MGAEQSQLEKLQAGEFSQGYISFFVNGREYNVKTGGCDPEIGPQYLLVDYLRDKLGLTGTKYMCREGGCGACLVTLRTTHPVTGQQHVTSANSCLLPLYSVDGYEITTVEKLGNRQVGYNPIQERLTKFAGTQCGFCTPGFVMNMNSLMQSNPRFTTSDVEYSFDGNICRCTGFRPIMDAFKSLAVNPSEELKWKCVDIEDTYKCPMKTLKESQDTLLERPEILHSPRNLFLQGANGEDWFKVTNLSTLYDILHRFAMSGTRYRLVAGNTGTGVYKNDGPYNGFIEINDVPELQYTSVDQTSLVLGGGVTLTAAIELFDAAAQTGNFVYAREFYNHLRRVAALPVRNRGTIAGNLMMKHLHRDFISDVFVLFESVGATVTIGSSPTLSRQYTLLEFLEVDMTGKVLLSVHLPALFGTYFYKCYKLGRRHQNAAALVNCGILVNIDPNSLTIVKQPRICYGGINESFVHATATEAYLKGKTLNVATLQGALTLLGEEVKPDEVPQNGGTEYRRGLAQSFLYRCLLNIRGNAVNPRLRTGADEILRGDTKGKQIYETDRTKWPLNQPMPKLESLPQCSGEAQFVNDIRREPGELFGVFVLSNVANATIKSIDASQALMTPGVVAFITAEDVPGVNNFAILHNTPEEIFASKRVGFAGQAIGLLVASDKAAAFGARSRVVVHYDDIKRPVLDLKEVVTAQEKNPDNQKKEMNLAFPCRGIDTEAARNMVMTGMDHVRESGLEADENVTGTMHQVKGEFRMSAQYHFHMETQICLCVPNEDGMDVYSATQHMDAIQIAVATCLNVPNHSITVHVRRLGGAFGAKISKANHIAAACAVAAHVTHRPVRVALDLETNMQMIGKRLPYLVRYDVKVDDTGKIYKLDSDLWCDGGTVANEPTSLYAMICMQSCYRGNGWNVKPNYALTDTPANTFCRSPGSSQGAAAIEYIMEHIAHTVKKDPLKVREINFIKKGDPFIGVPGARLPLDNLLPGMLAELKVNGEYESRKKFVEEFNKMNRWKKRGIAVATLRYPNHYADLKFPTFISVYSIDGTVNVSHGGIEVGQGMNTKVAQVVAHTLQIPLEKVKVKPSNNIISPNSGVTGASIGSELVCSSARRACEQLLAKLQPVREQLENPTWEQLITAANAREMLLTSQFQEMQGDVTSYDVWGATLIEVEIDVLTGDFKIVRADIIEDAGQSMSPLIDVGQVEGAFVMALGWWVTEELIYDKDTGQLLTDNTWNYKPMLPADIPEDFRVTLLRNAPNPFGVLSSKATGEPPFNMAISVVLALRHAIDSARQEVGNYDWYQLDGPVTREVIRRMCLTLPDQFTF